MAHSAQAQQALSPLSGFPEWLPAGRVVEQHFIDVLRHVFELHGFSGIQTRAVEPLSELTRKGETSKEVYLLSRLQADPAEAAGTDPAGRLGLHFDLTVPFARYVLDNAGVLHFPFKRYQIQKVWRGERPQEGRFREFYQVDIDVVGDGSLPPHYDAEIPLIMHQALSALPIPPVTIHVSNRKVAQGFYKSVGIGDEALIEVLRVVDKIDKIGPGSVAAELVDAAEAEAEEATAERDAKERTSLLRALGLEGDARIPPALRAQVRQLEEDQKRRARRARTDVLDRAMIDLLSFYRDVLTTQMCGDVERVNIDLVEAVDHAAASTGPEQSLARIAAIEECRMRLRSNAAPLLAVEALMVRLRPQA